MNTEKTKTYELTFELAHTKRELSKARTAEASLHSQLMNKNEEYQSVLNECKKVKVLNAKRNEEKDLLSEELSELKEQISTLTSQEELSKEEINALNEFQAQNTGNSTTIFTQLEHQDEVDELKRELADAQAKLEVWHTFDGEANLKIIKESFTKQLEGYEELLENANNMLLSGKEEIEQIEKKLKQMKYKLLSNKGENATDVDNEISSTDHERVVHEYVEQIAELEENGKIEEEQYDILEKENTSLEEQLVSREEDDSNLYKQQIESLENELMKYNLVDLDAEIDNLPASDQEGEDAATELEEEEEFEQSGSANQILASETDLEYSKINESYLLTQSELIEEMGSEILLLKSELEQELEKFLAEFDENKEQIAILLKELVEEPEKEQIINKNFDEEQINKLWHNNETMSQYLKEFVTINKIMIEYLRKYSSSEGSNEDLIDDFHSLLLENAKLKGSGQATEPINEQLQEEEERYERIIISKDNALKRFRIDCDNLTKEQKEENQRNIETIAQKQDEIAHLRSQNEQLLSQVDILQAEHEMYVVSKQSGQYTEEEWKEREELFASKYDKLAFEKNDLEEKIEELEEQVTIKELQIEENNLLVEQYENKIKEHMHGVIQQRDTEKDIYLEGENEEESRSKQQKFTDQEEHNKETELCAKVNELESQNKILEEKLRLITEELVNRDQEFSTNSEKIEELEEEIEEKIKEEEEQECQNTKQEGDLTVSELGSSLFATENEQYLMMIEELKQENNTLKKKLEEVLGKEE